MRWVRGVSEMTWVWWVWWVACRYACMYVSCECMNQFKCVRVCMSPCCERKMRRRVSVKECVWAMYVNDIVWVSAHVCLHVCRISHVWSCACMYMCVDVCVYVYIQLTHIQLAHTQLTHTHTTYSHTTHRHNLVTHAQLSHKSYIKCFLKQAGWKLRDTHTDSWHLLRWWPTRGGTLRD